MRKKISQYQAKMLRGEQIFKVTDAGALPCAWGIYVVSWERLLRESIGLRS